MVKLFGRETELQTLYQNLQQYDQVAITAVEGMGGVGKTHLAIEYAHLHLQLKTYPGGICWLRAREEDINIETQILQFATTKLGLKPPENWDTIKQIDYCWLNWRPDGDVLIVLDDVTDYPKVEPHLPLTLPRFKSLITTRLQLDLPLSIPLNILYESSALELLKFWVGEKVTQELETAKELCEFLGYLPLALNLVGRYIKKRNISLAEMLRRLEREKISHQALAKDEKDRTWTLNVKSGVIAAFELSWSELSNDAKQLAVLLSLFALAPIPWSLVEKVETGKDAEQLEDIRVELENLHLLQSKENYELHPLIRQFFQLKQNEIDETEELKRAFCQVMVEVAKEIPENPIREEVKTFSPLIPHLAEVATNLITYIDDQDIILPFSSLGRFYGGQGLYHQAEPWLKQSLDFTQQNFGLEHPNVAISLSNLGNLYNLQGRYSAAESMLCQALKIQQNLLEDKHPDIATTFDSLASLYKDQGRFADAEAYYLQALEMRQNLWGKQHLKVSATLNNLALLYRLVGLYKEAEAYYLEALQIKQNLGEQESPDFATNLNNLAVIYRYQGKYEKAETLYNQALELRQRLLGQEHPDVAQTLNNLGVLCRLQEKYTQSENFHLQALKIRQNLLGKEHPDVADSLYNLASVYCSQKRYTEAESLYLQALAIRQLQLRQEHPYIVENLNSLALLYFCQNKYQEAEAMYVQALDICEKSLGVNHQKTITIRENLHICQQALDNLPNQ